jgi:hypothetical protein
MTSVLILAKAPRAGAAKTRLEPLLGPYGCARLQAELIRQTTGWTTGATPRVWLAYTPPDGHSELARLVPRRVRLFPQAGGDLGVRLKAATEHVFRRDRDRLIVIGTDAPELGPVHLRFAEHALATRADACLIPALDGGYALIGLARSTAAAFDLPTEAWGGPDVLTLTLTALTASGCGTALLEPVRDLDTLADARSIVADPRCPPAIRQALRDRSAT